MVKTTKDSRVEQYDKAMPKNHWLRNKKQVVNFLHDTPFAIDRQLEDQRFAMEKNRNPQLYNPTKVDKVRSETIIAKKGSSRPVAVKANVLNKIVREASGVHNYTIVAPPREKMPMKKSDVDILDPETNPRVKSYANEAKQKPVLCSFGHRPSSASRTFHPATMKFRLKHGEIATDTTKTGFGLPVSILSQILHAPKIEFNPGAELDVDPSTVVSEANQHNNDYNDLFFTASEQETLFQSRNNRKLKSMLDENSWVSSVDAASTTRKQNPKLEPLHIDRPGWDEAHHRVKVGSNEVFAMRMSGLNDLAQQPLSEKLKRFAKLSVAESQFVPFCTEKQETDKLILSGVKHRVPKSKPVKGSVLYFDPWDVELAEVKKYRREVDRKRLDKIAADDYQTRLRTIPKVDYYPTTKLSKIGHSSTGNLTLNGQSQHSLTAPSSSSGRQADKPLNLLSFSYPMEYRPVSSVGDSYHDETTDDAAAFYIDEQQEGSPSSRDRTRQLSRELPAAVPSHSRSLDLLMSGYDTEWQNLERDRKAAMRAAKKGDVNALYDFNIRQKHSRPESPLPSPDSNGPFHTEEEEREYVPPPDDLSDEENV